MNMNEMMKTMNNIRRDYNLNQYKINNRGICYRRVALRAELTLHQLEETLEQSQGLFINDYHDPHARHVKNKALLKAIIIVAMKRYKKYRTYGY